MNKEFPRSISQDDTSISSFIFSVMIDFSAIICDRKSSSIITFLTNATRFLMRASWCCFDIAILKKYMTVNYYKFQHSHLYNNMHIYIYIYISEMRTRVLGLGLETDSWRTRLNSRHAGIGLNSNFIHCAIQAIRLESCSVKLGNGLNSEKGGFIASLICIYIY